MFSKIVFLKMQSSKSESVMLPPEIFASINSVFLQGKSRISLSRKKYSPLIKELPMTGSSGSMFDNYRERDVACKAQIA
jgi:hypothetical protein